MPSPKIAIVGSGPAAASCLVQITNLAPQANVTVFDVGNPIRTSPFPEATDAKRASSIYDALYNELRENFGLRFPPQKTRFGQGYPSYEVSGQRRFYRSENYGGMSAFWGGTMLPFQKHDFEDWPIEYEEILPYYRQVASHVGITGERDGLSAGYPDEFANRPPLKHLRGLQELARQISGCQAVGYKLYAGGNRAAIETRSASQHSCQQCGECMAGCYRESIYNSGVPVERMLTRLGGTLVQSKVRKISPIERTLVLQKGTREIESESFDYIFLCAGCIGTTEIVARSIAPDLTYDFVDNAIFQIPILNLGLNTSDEDKGEYVAFANTLIAGNAQDPSLRDFHAQVYPNFDYLWRRALPTWAWRLVAPVVRWSRDRVGWMSLYTDGRDGWRYSMTLGDNGMIINERGRPRKAPFHQAANAIRCAMENSPFHLGMMPPVVLGTSAHLAGPLSYNNQQVNVSKSGEIMQGIYVCDSAVFPNSPAASLTFTIMANAARTVTMALS